jgi:hypothetical protein
LVRIQASIVAAAKDASSFAGENSETALPSRTDDARGKLDIQAALLHERFVAVG